jgi:spermidine synthase
MWTHVDTDAADGMPLDLYERDGVYMIRAGGWELMNGAYHDSEDRLGRLAALLAVQSAGRMEPAILVGGLGLGYTLAGLLEALPGRARITVAERSGAVLRWFGAHINPRLAATLPAWVRLIEADVADQLGGQGKWDVIVLDVDNGPEALSAPGNAALYGEDGLARCRAALADSGCLLLWSGFDDHGFVARAAAAGFVVTRHAVPIRDRADQSHVVYVLSRGTQSSAI